MSTKESVWKALRRVAEAYDESPVSVRNLGERLTDAHYERRRQRAATDETWAEIEARRENEHGTITFLSEDLTLADWEKQDRIADELTPDPLWLPLAYKLKEFRVGAPLSKLEFAYQRITRGWADTDVWGLHSTHERVLGEQLLHLAETAHGWPGNEEFPTYEDWTRTLRHHGNVLVKHGWTEAEEGESLHAWYTLATDPDAPEEAEEAARIRRDEEEAAANERVKESLHWVAEHNQHLWD